MAAGPIFFWTKALPAACLPSSFSPPKTGPSPAGILAVTLPRAPNRLPLMRFLKSTIPTMAPRMARSTKAPPRPKSAARNSSTSQTSAPPRWKSTSLLSSAFPSMKTLSKPRAFRAASLPSTCRTLAEPYLLPYAKQDALRHDPVGGDGLGFVELFSPSGKHIGHLEHGDWFNAPWGVVWTTRDFGEFSNAILVGNFRSGWIAAFNGFTHKFIGWVRNPDDSLVTIDGLWSLTFGNDATAGPANTLFFTAGINNEQDGLFGTLTLTHALDGDA